MTGWTPDVSQMTIIVVGVIQGIGLGFIFVPLSVVTLSTLSSELRAEGAGLLQSVAQHRLQRRHLGGEQPADDEHAGQSRRHRAARHGRQPGNVRRPGDRAVLEPVTAAGRAALDAVITQQAQIIAYIDDYKLLMIATLAVIPLLIVFKRLHLFQMQVPEVRRSALRLPCFQGRQIECLALLEAHDLGPKTGPHFSGSCARGTFLTP
jgi:DHA2 family multidrug resistance protein